MYHRHQNHRIKIVSFNQADNDKTIPNTLYGVIKTLYTQLPV